MGAPDGGALAFELHTQVGSPNFLSPKLVGDKGAQAVHDLFQALAKVGYKVISKEVNNGDPACCEFVLAAAGSPEISSHRPEPPNCYLNDAHSRMGGGWPWCSCEPGWSTGVKEFLRKYHSREIGTIKCSVPDPDDKAAEELSKSVKNAGSAPKAAEPAAAAPNPTPISNGGGAVVTTELERGYAQLLQKLIELRDNGVLSDEMFASSVARLK